MPLKVVLKHRYSSIVSMKGLQDLHTENCRTLLGTTRQAERHTMFMGWKTQYFVNALLPELNTNSK